MPYIMTCEGANFKNGTKQLSAQEFRIKGDLIYLTTRRV